MTYHVRTDVFQGPFDLLLHLVRINEIDIYDIPIAEITNQYLEIIKDTEKIDLASAGDFLVMAATLINLKARTLMPPQTAEEAVEEEQEVDEEYESIRDAQDLMRRLVEYRQFKELAVQLSDREEEQLRVFYRNQVLPELVDGQAADPSFFREDISLLFSAFARVLEITEGRPTHHVIEEEFTVEEKVETIQTLLNRDRRLSIYGLFEHCLNKQECITTFLALLEVCRLKVARLKQKGNYQDILLVLASEYEEDDEEEED